MRKIMAVNAGSSSLKFQLLEMPAEIVIVSGIVESIGTKESKYSFKVNGEKVFEKKVLIEDHKKAVQIVLDELIDNKYVKSLTEISGIGHRVVQGGDYFSDSCLVDEKVKALIEELIPLAPLHNKAHLTGINAFESVLPNVPNVVVFDTAFHRTMPETSYLYGVPYKWYTENKVRKYGAHGTSHQYVANICAEVMEKDINDLKIITCHLGNGASITAVKNGKCLDTSMGLTPLDGIPMGTRSGSLDPTVLEYMSKQDKEYSLEKLIKVLNHNSGYLGISELSNDSRTVENGMKSEDPEVARKCKLALELQYKRIADYIGSYYVLMEGVDAIVFTAGIGENSSYCRERICDRVKVLGVEIDKEFNASPNARGKLAQISTKNSAVKVFVIPTNEELVIARDVMRLTSN